MEFLEQFLQSLPETINKTRLLEQIPEDLWKNDPEFAATNALAQYGGFDVEDYYARYPDVESEEIDPILHFVRHGLAEGRYFKYLEPNNLQTGLLEVNYATNVPKVSVIMPVFNNARFLRECFDSVLNQTLKEIEIIIVDDGSTDQAAVNIMDEYAAKDQRIKLIHKQNTGYGHSMNVGIGMASGKYIGIVESDDYILPEMYNFLTSIADEHNLDFIKSDYQLFYGDKDKRIFEKKIIYSDLSVYNKVLKLDETYNYFHIYNTIWNGIYNRNFLLKHNIKFNETPGASYQDNGFWFQTLIHSSKFMITDKFFYMLRRDNSESSIFNKDKALCMIMEYNFIYNLLKKHKSLYDKYKKIFRYKCFNNYMFTLYKVDKPYRLPLLELYQKEFFEANKNGEIDRVIFGKDYAKAIDICQGVYRPTWLDTPYVSVIMAVYNAEKYLNESVNSILTQTFRDIELICVDDGSTDNSLAILRDLARSAQRMKVFSQENAGPGTARNMGLKHAKGDYVIFLDADDVFAHNMIEKLYLAALVNNADMCVCKSGAFENDIKNMNEIKYAMRLFQLPPKKVFTAKEIKGNVFKAFTGWAWDKIFKKDFLQKNNLFFPCLSSSEDMQFVYSALLKAEKIAISTDLLVYHRINVPNSVSNTREKNPLDFMQSLIGLKEFMRFNDLYEHFFYSFASYAVHAYLWNYNSLKGDSVLQLYNKRYKFYTEMDLDKMHPENFYNKDEYTAFIEILKSKAV